MTLKNPSEGKNERYSSEGSSSSSVATNDSPRSTAPDNGEFAGQTPYFDLVGYAQNQRKVNNTPAQASAPTPPVFHYKKKPN